MHQVQSSDSVGIEMLWTTSVRGKDAEAYKCFLPTPPGARQTQAHEQSLMQAQAKFSV